MHDVSQFFFIGTSNGKYFCFSQNNFNIYILLQITILSKFPNTLLSDYSVYTHHLLVYSIVNMTLLGLKYNLFIIVYWWPGLT